MKGHPIRTATLVVAVSLVGLAVGAAWLWESSAFTTGLVESRVRHYLLQHPEVIVEALQALDERQRAAEIDEVEAAIAENGDRIFNDPGSPVGGNPRGDVTLVEFFDYNCPYCRAMAPTLAEARAADPELRIVYKEFPILGPGSEFAARAALAAAKQGRYQAFHEALMGTAGPVDEQAAIETAAAVGIDVARLKADMTDPGVAEQIAGNLALAEALRISGTPGFVVGDAVLRGATDLSTLQGLVAAAREAAAPTASASLATARAGPGRPGGSP